METTGVVRVREQQTCWAVLPPSQAHICMKDLNLSWK